MNKYNIKYTILSIISVLVLSYTVYYKAHAATLVGTQESFIAALKELLELDYDAVEAYNTAIDKVKHREFKKKMIEFRNDHQKNTKELTQLIRNLGDKPPKGPGAKQYLTKGKVYVATLIGDKLILNAMRDNEEDTNAAYERVYNHKSKITQAEEVLSRLLNKDSKHLEWFDNTLKDM
jgi:uncharacterized protein (TIGR02284 family)